MGTFKIRGWDVVMADDGLANDHRGTISKLFFTAQFVRASAPPPLLSAIPPPVRSCTQLLLSLTLAQKKYVHTLLLLAPLSDPHLVVVVARKHSWKKPPKKRDDLLFSVHDPSTFITFLKWSSASPLLKSPSYSSVEPLSAVVLLLLQKKELYSTLPRFPQKLMKQSLTWYIMIPMTTHAMQPMTPRRTRKKVLMPDMEEGFGSSTWSRGEEKKEEEGWMPGEEGGNLIFILKSLWENVCTHLICPPLLLPLAAPARRS